MVRCLNVSTTLVTTSFASALWTPRSSSLLRARGGASMASMHTAVGGVARSRRQHDASKLVRAARVERSAPPRTPHAPLDEQPLPRDHIDRALGVAPMSNNSRRDRAETRVPLVDGACAVCIVGRDVRVVVVGEEVDEGYYTGTVFGAAADDNDDDIAIASTPLAKPFKFGAASVLFALPSGASPSDVQALLARAEVLAASVEARALWDMLVHRTLFDARDVGQALQRLRVLDIVADDGDGDGALSELTTRLCVARNFHAFEVMSWRGAGEFACRPAARVGAILNELKLLDNPGLFLI